MTFPETPIDGTWTDITGYVFDRETDAIRIIRGKRDWAAQVDRSIATMTLNNVDGRFSPRNPNSPYYGVLGRNTPLRVSVDAGQVFMLNPRDDDTAGATVADNAQVSVTGDLDVRIEFAADENQGDIGLAAKYLTTGDNRSWYFLWDSSGALQLSWSPTGLSGGVIDRQSTVTAPGGNGRRAFRATLDVDNGSSGHVVTFYTATSLAGPWEPLGEPVVGSGTTSIFDGTADLECGRASGVSGATNLSGRVFAFELYAGSTVVANPDFTAQTAGDTSFADTASSPNTWTLVGDAELTNRNPRFYGEVSSWPQRWDLSGNDVYVPLEASGILRRLNQGTTPLRSAVTRGFMLRSDTVAYWPLEDGQEATSVASALSGGTAGVINGVPSFGDFSDLLSSAPLPVMGTGSFSLPLGSYTVGNDTTLTMFVKYNPDEVADQRLFSMKTSGTAARFELAATSPVAGAASFALSVYDASGTALVSDSAFNVGAAIRTGLVVSCQFVQDGADVDYTIRYFDTTEMVTGENPLIITNTGTVSSATIGRVIAVHVAPDEELGDTASIGHVAVSNALVGQTELTPIFSGHVAEEATDRFSRLSAEESVSASLIGGGRESLPMGTQTPETYLTLVNECIDTETGVLAEPRDFLGLRMYDRLALRNQAPALSLAYTDGEVDGSLDPVDDDQQTRNYIKVTRKGGSSYLAVEDTGPLSIQDPPDGIGTYDSTPIVNPFRDSALTDAGEWLRHEGTVDEARYPQLSLNLAVAPFTTDPAVLTDVMLLDSTSRIVVSDLPPWLPPEDVSQLVLGYTETIRNFTWRISCVCTPEAPYRVAVAGDSVLGHAGSSGSELSAASDTVTPIAGAATLNSSGATSVTVNVPVGTLSGHVMVALIGLIGQDAITAPAGWTLIGTQDAGSNVRYASYYRVAGSEPANYTWSWAGSFKSSGWIRTYSNVDTTSPIAASFSVGTSVSGTGFAAGPVTIPEPAGFLVYGVFERHPASGSATTWTTSDGSDAERLDHGSNGGSGQDMSHATYDSNRRLPAEATSRTLTASQTVSQVATWAIALTPDPSTLSVATTSGPLWSVSADDYPIDVMVGGERMTVENPSAGLTDTFTRTVSNGWGTADSGDVWTTSGGSASDYSVNGSSGLVSLGSVNVRFTVTPVGPNVTIYDSVTVPVTATGASISGGYVARYTDDNNFYLYQILHDSGGLIDLQIVKRVAGTFTTLGSASDIIGYTPGVPTHVRCLCSGSTLTVKIWRDGSVEPAAYQLTATDTTFTSGSVGTHSNLLSSNTNTLPVVVTYDNIGVAAAGVAGSSSPQTFTVTRSVNGIVKAHDAGDAVTLFQPAELAI